MTGQHRSGSYSESGIFVVVDLVNEVATVDRSPEELHEVLTRVLAVDPPSVAQLAHHHVPGFVGLARTCHEVVARLVEGDVDSAAGAVNDLLADHPAHPHLSKEGGEWRLHHHPQEADLVPMWTAIAAEALAGVIGTGRSHRLGTCAAPDCERAYLDQSRNGSRRFCTTACQNRVKAAAFRRRQSRGGRGGSHDRA